MNGNSRLPKLASRYTLLSVLLGLSLLLNVVAIVQQILLLVPPTKSHSESQSHFHPSKYFTEILTAYIGHDHPREAPIKLRTVNLALSDDLEHYFLEGRQAVAEWNALHPEGQGSVYLGDSTHVNGELQTPYHISMFHQLQCLNHLRATFIYGNDQPARTEHCVTYLLQGIMCFSDTTLEEGGVGAKKADGDVVAPANNNTHTCRDWSQLYDFASENRKRWSDEQIELEAELSKLCWLI
jgi:hypothetical protein